MLRPRPGVLRLAAVCSAAILAAFSYPFSSAASEQGVVISEFRVRGPAGGNDEFIEIHNPTNSPIAIGGWKLNGSNVSATTGTRATIPAGTTIGAGCYYLAANTASAGYSAGITPDLTYTTGITDTGGIALLTSSDIVVDAVGLSTGSAYSEGTPLPNLGTTTAANLNRGYERRPGGAAGNGTDTDDNSADFFVASPSAPQNSASTCITGSTSTNPTGTASATPNAVEPGAATLLTVTATGGQNPSSTTLSVTGDLSSIGGSASQILFDDGANGDAVPGDLTFSVEVTVDSGTTPGAKTLTFTVADDQARSSTTSTSLTVIDTTPPPPPPTGDVVISQVYGGGGNAGATLTHDFIELFNRGTTVVNLSGWSVQYTGATGTMTWQATPLAGSIQPGGYYLVQQAAGAGGTTALPAPDATGSIAMGGPSGKVALRSTTEAFFGACPADPGLIDLVGYGSANCFEGAGRTSTLSNTLAALRRRDGCQDSNNNNIDFATGAPAPRNGASPAKSCALQFTTLPIHTIQGSGAVTPYAGQDVRASGIVTTTKSNGFFLQAADADIDGDANTSEAIFVFVGAAPSVTAGDMVTVQGTAAEFFSLTQIESTVPGDVTVTSSGHALPSAVQLTTTILDPGGTRGQMERFEGMRMHADSLVSVAPTNGFGEIYTVLGGVARPMREPGIEAGETVPPDPETGIVEAGIPTWDLNPERLLVDTDGRAGATRLYVTSNVTLTGVTGPLDFAFGEYKVIPETPPVASANMSAVAVPAPMPNEFTVAGYNIENFANAPTQRLKAAQHIRAIMRSPDVIGLVEIASLSALQALAAQVNADALAAGDPDPQYEARLIPFGTNDQHVGFLVKTSRVHIHGVTQERAGDMFEGGSLHDRPPLVLDATVDPFGANPGRILVVVNHLRSFIDIEDLGATGARVRAKRKAQAEAVAELLQDLQQNNPNVPVIAVGDYNAYEFSDGYTDPISVLKGQPTPGDQIVVAGSPDVVNPDFVNLTDTMPADQRYSFIFEGTPQALDHVLVNHVAHSYLQRYAIARGNADFPDAGARQGDPGAGFSDDPTRPEANSDHDAPIAYFAFPGTPVVALNGPPVMEVEAFTSFTDPGATAHDDNGPLPVVVTGSVDVNVPGTYTLLYSATNGYATTTVPRTVIVKDTVAPDITGFSVTPTVFGPPNHKMFDVSTFYSATDASGSTACVLSVTSNEPVNGVGDGNTAIDWEVVSATRVRLRAERAGNGSGRVYTITVTCTDASGNASARTATVTIAR